MWFDPTCPWAWMTSRWLGEVADTRGFDVDWRVMSLSVLNEGRDLAPDYRAMLDSGWGPVRVVIAAREAHGDKVVKPLYDALGTQIHPGESTDPDTVIAQALAEVGLPPEFAEHSLTDEFDPQMRASHFDGIGRVGQDVVTPVIAIGDIAFFGPVISPIPRGEQALSLWDGLVAVASYDGFFELKRSRTRDPIFD